MRFSAIHGYLTCLTGVAAGRDALWCHQLLSLDDWADRNPTRQASADVLAAVSPRRGFVGWLCTEDDLPWMCDMLAQDWPSETTVALSALIGGARLWVRLDARDARDCRGRLFAYARLAGHSDEQLAAEPGALRRVLDAVGDLLGPKEMLAWLCSRAMLPCRDRNLVARALGEMRQSELYPWERCGQRTPVAWRADGHDTTRLQVRCEPDRWCFIAPETGEAGVVSNTHAAHHQFADRRAIASWLADQVTWPQLTSLQDVPQQWPLWMTASRQFAVMWPSPPTVRSWRHTRRIDGPVVQLTEHRDRAAVASAAGVPDAWTATDQQLAAEILARAPEPQAAGWVSHDPHSYVPGDWPPVVDERISVLARSVRSGLTHPGIPTVAQRLVGTVGGVSIWTPSNPYSQESVEPATTDGIVTSA